MGREEAVLDPCPNPECENFGLLTRRTSSQWFSYACETCHAVWHEDWPGRFVHDPMQFENEHWRPDDSAPEERESG